MKLTHSELLKSINGLTDNTNKLDSQDYSSLNDVLEKVLSSQHEDKTVSLMSINEKELRIDIREMIARCFTHAKHVMGKSVENATIEDMPNINLKHIHEMHQSLKRDKIICIVK